MTDEIHIFISSLRGGGSERVCVTVANGLVEKNISVNLVVLNLEEEVYLDNIDDNVRVVNLEVTRTRKSLPSIYGYFKENSPKKVLVFDFFMNPIIAISNLLSSTNAEITVRINNTISELKDYEFASFSGQVAFGLIKQSFKYSSSFIAQSEGMAKDFRDSCSIPDKEIAVIHNPLSAEFDPPQDQLAGDINRNSRTQEVLFVGRLTYSKGVWYLIEAFASMAKIGDIQLHIVGKGDLERELKAEVRRRGIENQVKFHGFVNDVKKYYERADLTVLPSMYEGFPNVLIESISVGTPVVAFDCPSGPSEIVEDGINGFLIDLKDKQMLEEKISESLQKKWVRDEVIRTSFEYSSTNIIEQYYRFLFD